MSVLWLDLVADNSRQTINIARSIQVPCMCRIHGYILVHNKKIELLVQARVLLVPGTELIADIPNLRKKIAYLRKFLL
jgi:uncharacterized membrane protein